MARTYFLWDPIEDNIIEEFDEAGNTIADYTTEPYLYGDLVSQHRDGQSRFYCYDILGSTLALTDLAGNVTDTTAYTALGEVTEQYGNTTCPFQYVGRLGYYGNAATSDYSLRRRRLISPLGRMLSADQPEYAGCGNPYVYVDSNPVNHVDPSGNQPNASLYPFVPTIKIQHASVTPCVDAQFTVKFGLPPSSIVSSGFVVQEVEVTTIIRDCDGKDVTHLYTDRPNIHYWEAFDIFSIRLRANVDVPDDTYRWAGDFSNTTGTRAVKGLAKGAGNVPLPDQFTDPIGVPEAGTLPVTVERPFGWDRFPGTQHDMTVTWDCCCEPYCVTMRTVPSWAIEIAVGPGASLRCPKQIPIYKDLK